MSGERAIGPMIRSLAARLGCRECDAREGGSVGELDAEVSARSGDYPASSFGVTRGPKTPGIIACNF
jgi:hypothetical protein